MNRDINQKFKSKDEAERIAGIENLGRDYSTAIVVKENDYYIIKII